MRPGLAVASLAGLLALPAPFPAHHQDAGPVRLGPEAIQTITLESPEILYRIGDPQGPGMIEQGVAMMMAPVPRGGVLVFTSYAGDGPVQYFRDGALHMTFGRRGDGPGEYRQVSGLSVNPLDQSYWVQDGMRLVSFSQDGLPGPVLDARQVSLRLLTHTFLSDGSLVLVGPGRTPENRRHILHHHDFATRTWSSHHPVLPDTLFQPELNIGEWRRRLALASDGRVVAITDDYVIEILNPDRDFDPDMRIMRRPSLWPENLEVDLARRKAGDPMAPGYAVSRAWVDPAGRLWVVSVLPDANWQEKIGPDPRTPLGRRWISDDFGLDSLVEVFDLEEPKVLGSFRLDPLVRFIVGPGLCAYYAGDLPFPQIAVLKIPL